MDQHGEEVFQPLSLDRMLVFNADGYGLGAERYRFGGLLGYGHSGLLRGYTTLLVHIPDANLTLAVLAVGHRFGVTDLLTYSGSGSPSILALAGELAPP